MPLNLFPWDTDMPLLWLAIREAVTDGVGRDSIEVMDNATMDGVLSSSFREAGDESTNFALWH